MSDNTLNPNQLEAVTHGEGPLLILAGAGSGKTRIITHRIVHLIEKQGISPHRILAVTFTNKAADEMKERIRKLIKTPVERLWIGTFHSICLRILRMETKSLNSYEPNFVIYDDNDQLKIIKELLQQLDVSEKVIDPRKARAEIDFLKSRGINTEINPDSPREKIMSKLLILYEENLKKNNAMDFGDLLNLTVRLFEENPSVLQKYQNKFEHILVDEYQDTNYPQYKIVKLLAGTKRNVFVVGDDNQSIYSWRGADINNILNFEKDFPDAKIIKLEKNYRSTKNIIEVSNHLIKNNTLRQEKRLWTDNPPGELVELYKCDNETHEAEIIVRCIKTLAETKGALWKEIAIFYRTNNQSKPIEDALIKEGIPYRIVGGTSFYQRAEIKDVIAYLRTIVNPKDNVSLKRIINTPPRGIGKVTITKLEDISIRNNVSLLKAIRIAIEEKTFSSRILKKLETFYHMINSFVEKASTMRVKDIIEHIITESGYMDYISDEEERLNNLSDLINLGEDLDSQNKEAKLLDFLEWTSLASDLDKMGDNINKVTLLTLHTAKGLEFPYVFIVGMEEGLLPHFRSLESIHQLEEERRLLYVGITRAQKKLVLSCALSRRYFGNKQRTNPSRFLKELPTDLISIKPEEKKDYENNEEVSKESSFYNTKTRNTFNLEAEAENRTNNIFKKGQIVLHKKFGKGVVLQTEGKGNKSKITVSFPGIGKKTIIASYLQTKV